MSKKFFVVSDTHNVFKDAKSPPPDPTAFTGKGYYVNGQMVVEYDPVHVAQKIQNEKEYHVYLGEFYKDYIDMWNEVVSPTDVVVHLGDVIWDTRKLSVFDHLNGVKHLVVGNHDDGPSEQYKKYFTSVQWLNFYEDVIFSHAPVCPDHPALNRSFIGEYTKSLDLSPYTVNVHGHFHYEGRTKEFFRGEERKHVMKTDKIFRFYDTNTHLQHYCVSHFPVPLDTIRQEMREYTHQMVAA